jgi:hypothetical protein
VRSRTINLAPKTYPSDSKHFEGLDADEHLRSDLSLHQNCSEGAVAWIGVD